MWCSSVIKFLKIFQGTNQFWLVPFYIIFYKSTLAQPTLCPVRNRRSGHPSERLGLKMSIKQGLFFIIKTDLLTYISTSIQVCYFVILTYCGNTTSLRLIKNFANFSFQILVKFITKIPTNSVPKNR